MNPLSPPKNNTHLWGFPDWINFVFASAYSWLKRTFTLCCFWKMQACWTAVALNRALVVCAISVVDLFWGTLCLYLYLHRIALCRLASNWLYLTIVCYLMSETLVEWSKGVDKVDKVVPTFPFSLVNPPHTATRYAPPHPHTQWSKQPPRYDSWVHKDLL